MCPCPLSWRFVIARRLTIALVALSLLLAASSARADVAPPTGYPLTAAAKTFRTQTYREHPCLARIIDLENGWWDPTVHNGGGHGDTSRSYGLPQGNPGTKMAYYAYTVGRHKAHDPTPSDWRTSRATQLAWMRNYAVGKFGSECGAYWSRVHNGTY